MDVEKLKENVFYKPFLIQTTNAKQSGNHSLFFNPRFPIRSFYLVAQDHKLIVLSLLKMMSNFTNL